MVTREDLVKIARETVERTTDQHDYFGPVAVKFDPHEWVLEAMRAAYAQGRADELRLHAAGAGRWSENTERG